MLGSDGKGKDFCHKRLKVSIKVVLFQLRGRGDPQNDATPNIFPDSKSLLLRLSNEVSFVSEIYWKGGQNSPNIFLKSCCMNIHVHQCKTVSNFRIGFTLSNWPYFTPSSILLGQLWSFIDVDTVSNNLSTWTFLTERLLTMLGSVCKLGHGQGNPYIGWFTEGLIRFI